MGVFFDREQSLDFSNDLFLHRRLVYNGNASTDIAKISLFSELLGLVGKALITSCFVVYQQPINLKNFCKISMN